MDQAKGKTAEQSNRLQGPSGPLRARRQQVGLDQGCRGPQEQSQLQERAHRVVQEVLLSCLFPFSKFFEVFLEVIPNHLVSLVRAIPPQMIGVFRVFRQSLASKAFDWDPHPTCLL